MVPTEASPLPTGVAARGDRRALLTASGSICVLFAVGAAVQASFVYGRAIQGGADSPFAGRLTSNAVALAINLLVLVLLRTESRRGPWSRVGAVVAAAAIGAGARVAGQVVLGVYHTVTPSTRLLEFAMGFGVALAANLLGLFFMTSRQRVRHEAHAVAAGQMQYRSALQALQGEEIRVRRDVAEGLHGSLQQHLVLLTARIDSLADRLADRPVTPADLVDLREISGILDRVRQNDVREISRMIYPDGIEVGMVPAVRNMLVRLPTSIATHLDVSAAVRLLDDPASPQLSQSERLLAARIVEEAITNALRHGGATSIEVRLAAQDGALRIRVVDDGTGFDDGAEVVRSGTARLADRLALVGGWLEVSSRPGAGAVLEAALPVTAAVTG